MLADYLASQWIFGLDEDKAFDEAVALAETVAGMLETAAEADDGLRAYEYFLSWFHVNAEKFRENAINERYGIISEETIYVFPTVFEKAMREGNFNPNRILRDWAERGWIETETRGGKQRFKVRKYDRETSERAYFVAVKRNLSDE